MSIEVQESQEQFLQRGGCFAIGLAYLRKLGTIPRQGQTPYHEYPKALKFSKGFAEVPWATETCDKQRISGFERKEIFETVIVHDEAEEDRILAGGKTSAQIEDERQALIRRCAGAGISVDPTWTTVRLRRELGDVMDAPPGDEMAALKAKLASLQEMARMRAEIADLEAQMSGAPQEDATTLRSELESLGVAVDKRWGAARLRAELERATAPGVAA